MEVQNVEKVNHEVVLTINPDSKKIELVSKSIADDRETAGTATPNAILLQRFASGDKLTDDEHRTVMDLLQETLVSTPPLKDSAPVLAKKETGKTGVDSKAGEVKTGGEHSSEKRFKSYEYDDSELFSQPAVETTFVADLEKREQEERDRQDQGQPDINPIASEPRRTQTEKSLKSQQKKQKKASRVPKTSGAKPKSKK